MTSLRVSLMVPLLSLIFISGAAAQDSSKNVSVSISPSGEIKEGQTITLTCSSDGNPPVQNYTWFKKGVEGALQKWTSQSHDIINISPADSGEYQCKATNTAGSRPSHYKILNVLYPPKNVSMSISPSGEVKEGRSVTLTCSSDGNPPAKYNWLKKVDKGDENKGTGQTYSIANVRSADSGEYQCIASNTAGSQPSKYKTLTVLSGHSISLYVGVRVGVLVAAAIMAVVSLV